jgi:hypothetical protein
MQLHEFIPRDQDVATFTDIVSMEVVNFRSPDPSFDFLTGMLKNASPACENVQINGPTKRKENNHDVAYAQVFCGREKGKTMALSSSSRCSKVKRTFIL